MEEIVYIGEHLIPGQLAHMCIILSFVSLMFAVFSYFQHTKKDRVNDNWNTLGRLAFYLHSISLFGLLAILFFIMKNQYYEYQYVQAHVSEDLPMRYILSAFWEGQEGSFLLWMFWHAILGILVTRSAGKWEAPVMVTVALVQLFINSMILGLHIEVGDFAYKFGINPTLLLREAMDIPLFNNPEYVSLISGEGLNPLLQNYWMTIHPPTVFFGFASVTIPFAFAIAAFWKRDYDNWLDPVLKWSLVSGTMLGLGIFMGCVWAYIALTFGGYWAWDPVENMSLVPWLFMIAGIHAVLIAKSTGYSIKSAYIMFGLSFITLLYSTFLTRSGVLGDTSVHAFTEMGLEWQLVSFILFFAIWTVYLYFKRRKDVKIPVKEESIYSREFWIQIGVLILLFSSILITVATSLPVYNKIMEFFDPNFIGKVIQDPVAHHNKYQLWIAVFIAALSAKTIFMRYKAFNYEKTYKRLIKLFLSLGVLAAIITYLGSFWIDYYAWQFTLLAYVAYFSILCNLYYFAIETKFNSRVVAMAMAHVGFAVMIIGVIATGLNSKTISTNPFAQRGLLEEDEIEKVVRLIKEKPFFVKDYWLTYESDTIIDRERFFKIRFDKTNDHGEITESFHLHPNVLFTNDYQKVAAQNPDTKHYIGRDIFTYIAGLPAAQMDVENAKMVEDSLNYQLVELAEGDTIDRKNFYAKLLEYNFNPQHPEYVDEEHDLGISVLLEVYNKKDSSKHILQPVIGLDQNMVYQYPDQYNNLNLKVKLSNSFIEQLYTPEPLLEYKDFVLTVGEEIEFEGYNIKLDKLNKEVEDKNYVPEIGDITIAGEVTLSKGDKTKILKPIYIIRGVKPMGVKDYWKEEGVHLRLGNINPATEQFSFRIAFDQRENIIVPIQIADDSPRDDIIVLRAISFPGINLFWLGCSMMIFGLFIGFLNRMRKQNV